MKKILFIFAMGFLSTANYAQNDTELGPLNGENENYERARDQLFGNWDFAFTSRGGVGRRPSAAEQYRVSFDRSGKVTISLGGKVVNGTNYSLMEDDARLVFSNWDAPEAFKLDEGPFDFDNNILWLRGEYNDKGATVMLVKAGTQAYTPVASATSSTSTTTYEQPAARTTTAARRAPAKKKGRR
jgi:hypothetical protein